MKPIYKFAIGLALVGAMTFFTIQAYKRYKAKKAAAQTV
jgi:hypothetical protein